MNLVFLFTLYFQLFEALSNDAKLVVVNKIVMGCLDGMVADEEGWMI